MGAMAPLSDPIVPHPLRRAATAPTRPLAITVVAATAPFYLFSPRWGVQTASSKRSHRGTWMPSVVESYLLSVCRPRCSWDRHYCRPCLSLQGANKNCIACTYELVARKKEEEKLSNSFLHSPKDLSTKQYHFRVVGEYVLHYTSLENFCAL